jgi:hypothetical protein
MNVLDMSLEELLFEMRNAGWSVAVHNDYRAGGIPMTFWLFTHPSGVWLKGEGGSDVEVMRTIANERRNLFGGLT